MVKWCAHSLMWAHDSEMRTLRSNREKRREAFDRCVCVCAARVCVRACAVRVCVCLDASKRIIQQWTERELYSTKGRWRTHSVRVNSSSHRSAPYAHLWRIVFVYEILTLLTFYCIYKNWPVVIYCFLYLNVDIFHLWRAFWAYHSTFSYLKRLFNQKLQFCH